MRAYFSIFDLTRNRQRIGFIPAELPKGTIPVNTENDQPSLQDNATLWLVLAALLVGFSAIFIMVIFFCYVCKKRKQQKTFLDPETVLVQKLEAKIQPFKNIVINFDAPEL